MQVQLAAAIPTTTIAVATHIASQSGQRHGVDSRATRGPFLAFRRLNCRLLPNGNRMFTLAEGGEWLRRARVTPSPDAGLGLLSDLQRAHLLFVADGSGADLATVEPGWLTLSTNDSHLRRKPHLKLGVEFLAGTAGIMNPALPLVA
jgi:hypothetical protein